MENEKSDLQSRHINQLFDELGRRNPPITQKQVADRIAANGRTEGDSQSTYLNKILNGLYPLSVNKASEICKAVNSIIAGELGVEEIPPEEEIRSEWLCCEYDPCKTVLEKKNADSEFRSNSDYLIMNSCNNLGYNFVKTDEALVLWRFIEENSLDKEDDEDQHYTETLTISAEDIKMLTEHMLKSDKNIMEVYLNSRKKDWD